MHEGVEIAFDGRRHPPRSYGADRSSFVSIYGQAEIQKDLMAGSHEASRLSPISSMKRRT